MFCTWLGWNTINAYALFKQPTTRDQLLTYTAVLPVIHGVAGEHQHTVVQTAVIALLLRFSVNLQALQEANQQSSNQNIQLEKAR